MGTGAVRPRKLKNGQTVYFIDYRDPAGHRVRQIVGPRKKAAEKALALRQSEVVAGTHRLPVARTSTPLFAQFADEWLQRARARRLAPKTLVSYEGTARLHLKPFFGDMRLNGITRRDVEAFLVAKTEETKPLPKKSGKKTRDEKAMHLAAKTVNEALRTVKAILADAVAHEYLLTNPAAGVKPIPRPNRAEIMHILQPDEIGRLLDAAEDPWRTLYFAGLHTGLRRGELLALHLTDLDARKRLVYVRRQLQRIKDGDHNIVRETPLKTKDSRRTIDISQAVVDALLALPQGDDQEEDYVFRSRAGGFIDPDNVDRAFKRHLDQAGLPAVRFHDLRHTHASLLIAANVHPKAIQVRLGHSSITVTMDRYGHLMPSAFEGVGERLDALVPAPNGHTVGTRTETVITAESQTARRKRVSASADAESRIRTAQKKQRGPKPAS